MAGEYTIRPLAPDTWDAFADLAERHNGVWGGCWCTFFHTFESEKTHTVEGNRTLKEQRVRDGRPHAALVFDGEVAVGWCEYGTPEELPNINHRKQYEQGLERLPDYRLTCFFVDKSYRRQGVATIALRGALRPHRRGRRRRRRGVPPGHGRQADHGLVPLQRHAHAVREGRVHVRPPQGQEPLRDAHRGHPRLSQPKSSR